jgi:hypothetical protein
VKQVPGTLASSLDPGLRSRLEWLTSNVSEPGEWVQPALLNGWASFGGGYAPFAYRKTGSFVTVRGLIRSGVLGKAAFVFPAGVRPSAHMLIPCIAETIGTPSDVVAFRVDLTPGGELLIGPYQPSATYAWVTLSFQFWADK